MLQFSLLIYFPEIGESYQVLYIDNTSTSRLKQFFSRIWLSIRKFIDN